MSSESESSLVWSKGVNEYGAMQSLREGSRALTWYPLRPLDPPDVLRGLTAAVRITCRATLTLADRGHRRLADRLLHECGKHLEIMGTTTPRNNRLRCAK